MDAFVLSSCVLCASAFAGYVVGGSVGKDALAKGCVEQSEMTVRKTVYFCRPLAYSVNGVRFNFKEQ